jgi:AraC-like DNA-binding protein
MADVMMLNTSPAALERVRRALALDAAGGTRHTLHPCRGWSELMDAAARSPLGVALVDPYHAGALAHAEIRWLRERVPRVEVVAYADFAHRPPADVFTLARLGVRAVLALGAGDEPAALWRCLCEHLNATPLEELTRRLDEVVPPRVLAWLAPALRSAVAPATPTELARAARCSPRTLRRALRAAGLPPATELLAWRRLLHAARLLEDHRSVESVARTLNYSSGSALRKSLRTHTGLRPTQVTAGGGVRLIGALFLARCGCASPG